MHKIARKHGLLLMIVWVLLWPPFPLRGNVCSYPKEFQALPRFEWTQIPEELRPEKGDVRFGYLLVPENRNHPEDSKIIKLAVALLKSTSESGKTAAITLRDVE